MHWSSLLLSTAPLLAAASTQLSARQSTTKFTVSTKTRFQTIDGFGFSAAFQRANLIVNLPAPKQQALLDLLFNTSTGAGFTILRNGIGSSPDSQKDYMNSIAPKSPGSPSATPNYVFDSKDSGQLWLSQQAVKYGVPTIYANAWSAPGYMKTNGDDRNGGTLCGISGAKCSSGDWRQAYANYLVRYIQFYLETGVNITYVGPWNEPDYTTKYASMNSNGAQSAEFIKIFRPTLDAANLTYVGIICCENTGWSKAAQNTQDVKAAGAENLVSVFSSHAYTSGLAGPISTKNRVWETEYADLNGNWNTAWYSNGGAGDGMTWAQQVYNGLVQSNLTAYLYWEAVQDGNTNEKMIKIVNNEVTVSKRFWAMAQFSRFVRPGAVRVQTAGANLKTSAFLNTDGTLAVQVLNTGSSAATVNFAVQGMNSTSVTAWLTDNKNDMNSTTATLGPDGSVTGAVPARGMVSFVLQ